MNKKEIKAYIIITGGYIVLGIFIVVWSIYCYIKNHLEMSFMTMILSSTFFFYANSRMNALNKT